MPLKYWDHAFLTATYLINLLPSKVINFQTPHERLLQEKPSYTSLRTFGCACWPNLRPYNNHKLAFRSIRCAFPCYSFTHKGFKCLDIFTGRIYISRDVVFDKDVFLFVQLHPNAGAQLRKEIVLLPNHLLSPGGVSCITNATDVSSDTFDHEQDTGAENLVQNSIETMQNSAVADPGTDFPVAAVAPDSSDPPALPHGSACNS